MREKPLFVFDLDSTITKAELLPFIAEREALGGELALLTERAMLGETEFSSSFKERVALLSGIPLTRLLEHAGELPLNHELALFISENRERCLMVTGNLDVLIEPIIERLNMQGRVFSSKAIVKNGYITGVKSVLNKLTAVNGISAFVAVGDGANDTEMVKAAEIGIAFGGVRRPPESLLAAADRVFFTERELLLFLKALL